MFTVYCGKKEKTMNKAAKPISLLLSLAILLSAAYLSALPLSAASQWAYIDATDVNIRADATTNSKSYGEISKDIVTVNGQKKGTDNYTWYNITYGSITGYIRGDYVTLIDYENDKAFEKQIAEFPESYRQILRVLHVVYPNWKFYADNISMTLDEAVALEVGRKVSETTALSWRSMDLGSYDWGTGKWSSQESGRWWYVSREVVGYYMDPRNFLNSSYIYSYLQLDYDPTAQNEEGLKKIIEGTFLEKGYSDQNDTQYGGSYIKVIMEAARQSDVNPYVIAATIRQEQGVNGTSDLISGNYKGYEGYYNFFNVRANGENPVLNGLIYAKNNGWTSRSKAIIGGAKFMGNNYISTGQNTYFYMNYNIKDPDRIWHEYASAVHNATSSGNHVSDTYKNLKNAQLNFYIPVYSVMPSSPVKLPAKNSKLNNYYFNSISVSGLTPSFSRFTYSYDLKVTGDTTIKVTMPEGASYVSANSYALGAGINTIRLKVKSQSGYTTDYVIDVNASKACTLYIDSGNGIVPGEPEEPETPDPDPDPDPEPEDPPAKILRGDTNGDGKITLIDLANVQRHLLKLITLTGNNFKGGDTNGDGKITLIDLANIQRHLLHLISLS